MKSKLAASLVASAILCAADRLHAQIPTTPAGRQLSAWLEAMNSGNRATIQAFRDAS